MKRGSRVSYEIWALVIFSFALLLILSLVSYHPGDRPPNSAAGIKALYGFVGFHLANFLRQGIGLSAFLMPFFLLLAAYQLFRDVAQLTPSRVAGFAFLVLLSIPILLSVFIEADEVWDTGGVIGGFAERAILAPLFGRAGSYVVALSLFLVGFVFVCRVSLADLMRSLISRLASSRSKIAGPSLSPEPPQINQRGAQAPPIEKRPKPVQERFAFMEKDLK